MVNELCDSVSLCEMIEFSSRCLSKNVQSYLSILDDRLEQRSYAI